MSPILQPGLRGLFTSDSIDLCYAEHDTCVVTVLSVLETWGRVHLTNVDTAAGIWGVSFHFAQAGSFPKTPLLNLPFETGPYSSPVLFSFCLSIPVCLCFPCDIGSGNKFLPREKLMVRNALGMNFQESASGGAEAVAGGV